MAMRWIRHDENGNQIPGDFALPQEGPGEWVNQEDIPTVASGMIVSRFQALAALMQAGLLQDVTDWANAPTTDPLHKLAFETATEFSITSATMTAGAAALGWSNEQLQALFEAASEIVA